MMTVIILLLIIIMIIIIIIINFSSCSGLSISIIKTENHC